MIKTVTEFEAEVFEAIRASEYVELPPLIFKIYADAFMLDEPPHIEVKPR